MSSVSLFLPVIFTLIAWWSSTGIIIYLDGLPRDTYRLSFSFATALLVFALVGISVSAFQPTVIGMYSAFISALLAWGWLEMAFLMGYIVGPRQGPCPPDSRGWRRALFAIAAILYHEIALLAGMAVVATLTWNASNQLAAWTFFTLWACRQSTKLNLFLGARNFSEQFLPEHLRYITTYFTRKTMNPLFPISVSVSSFAAAVLWQKAANATSDVDAVALSLLATLVTLGMLEHWFLMLPIPFERLWEWKQKGRNAAGRISITKETAHDTGLL